MKEGLFQLFDDHDQFIKLKLDNNEYINSVYASPEQVFAISVFSDEVSLLKGWEDAAEEVAIQIQSQLSGPYDLLRWDMYMLYWVEGPNISTEMKVRIENNRYFFRKLVLQSSDYPLSNKLPFITSYKRFQTTANEAFLFEQTDFLNELQACLSPNVAPFINKRLFQTGVNSAEELIQSLIEKQK